MLKKIRDKITEEVQQTSLRLPVSVQQSVQQLTQKSATDQWLEAVNEGSQLNLSPFSGAATSPGEQKKELETGSLQDELLVDISDIRPAGHNKDLFSIDEDSREGSPSKSGFQLVDLSDAETFTPADSGGGPGHGQGVAGVTFDPTITMSSSPTHRARRDSSGSSVSDVSGLFPIYEVPGVSFNMPQSDLESSSEWEDSSNTAVVDRLSKDTVYQAYLKMRQRYHKYKGRYADLARAYKDKERESDKLRDVLTKTQDKALRKVSELKEQCTLEQQAKAHLEQELRSDLEEKDHKITALQTKVSGLQEQCVLQQQAKAHLEEELNADLEEREHKISTLLTKVKILQEGVTGDLNITVAPPQNNEQSAVIQQDVCFIKNQDEGDSVSAGDNSSGTDNVSTTESVSLADNISIADNLSVASHGSASTAITINTEAEEVIEKLKGDVAKHKSLLARCMDNIRGNKERIALLTQERDIATTQLQDKLKQIDILKEEHVKELDSLRSSMESSALSMAETKKQLFEELQVKEAETERCKQASAAIEKQLEDERDRWQEELQIKQQELEEKETSLLELGTNIAAQEDDDADREESVAAIKKEVEARIHQLEARTLEFKESRTELEIQLTEINQAKAQLEEKVQQLMKDNEEFRKNNDLMEGGKMEVEQKLITLESVKVELEGEINDLTNVKNGLEEQVKELSECKMQQKEKLDELKKSQLDLQKQMEELQEAHTSSADINEAASHEIMALKEANGQLTDSLELSEKEKGELKATLEQAEIDKENILKDISEKRINIMDLEAQSAGLEVKLKTSIEENSDLKDQINCCIREKEFISKELNETRDKMEKELSSLAEETVCVKHEYENTIKELGQLKSEKENVDQTLLSLQKDMESLKFEKENLSMTLTEAKDNVTKVNQEAFTELNLVTEKMNKLNSDWAKQMQEKDLINNELSRKVSELDQCLKLKTDESQQKIESLNSMLRQTELNDRELQLKIESLQNENKIFYKDIGDMKTNLQAKETEILNFEKKMHAGNSELSARVVQLETDISSREVELTAVVEEKNKLNALIDKLKLEKNKLQDELKTAHGEVMDLKKVVPALQIELKDKEEQNKSLMEEMTMQSEKNKLTREEMQRVSESFETEMIKAKDSYAKLKNSYDKFIKEKDAILNEQNKVIAELEKKVQESKRCLCELQSIVTQKEDKIKSLLNEKKSMLLELEKTVEEQQNELKNKECLIKKRTEDYELKVEELEATMQHNEESLKTRLESSLEEKHDLEKRVAELSHTVLEKDEMIVRQAEEAEQRGSGRLDQKDEGGRAYLGRETELSLQVAAEGSPRCERDRFQKQHEENLASASLELNKSQQSQLEAARSSHQRAIATRDATIAALKDDLDKQQLSLQEELDTWRNKWRICRGSWLKLGANQSVRFWGKVSVAGVGGVPGSKAAWPRQPQAPTVEGDSSMADSDSKKQIELECQQVQEHLLMLTADRDKLHQEFEQLTRSSHRLLQQIQEDSTSASERKFHSYEAEKKRIEEKLEALENNILEKDKNIALLDAKAGDYLLQVSTTSNNLFDDEEKVEKPNISSDGGYDDVDAVGVGEGKVSIEGARVGSHEHKVDYCGKNAKEKSLVMIEGNCNEKEEIFDRKVNDADLLDGVGGTNEDRPTEVGEQQQPEHVLRDGVMAEEPPLDSVTEASADVAISKPKDGEVVVKVEAEKASEDNVKEEKCKEKELVQREISDTVLVKKGDLEKIKSVVESDNKDSVDTVVVIEEIKAEEKNELSKNVNVANTDKSLEEGKRNENDLISSAVTPTDNVSGLLHTEATSSLPSATSAPSVAPIVTADTTLPPTGIPASESSTKGIPGRDNAGKQTSGNGSPVRDQVVSLSMLVAELRRVKDDMGCMSVKEHSFIELEDQLQAANKEVSSLKVSMSRMSKDLEEKNQCYQALEEENEKKMDIEFKMSEIQDVTNKCTMLAEEKSDLLRKLEVLEIMMTEYRTEIEMLIAEKAKMEEQTKELLAAKTTASTAEAEIDSRTNVEEKEKEIEELVEKVQSMEKEMKELNDKLKVTNRHLKVMAREREHKQKECEVLRRKVETVELKMCELQGTFDMLVKAVMVERDDLIKEMEEKRSQIDDLQQTLVRLKDTHEQELENVLYDKKLINDELDKYKSGELRSSAVPMVEKNELDDVKLQKEALALEVKQKTEETLLLEKKVKTIQDDMTDFVNSLKDEMARLKEDSEKMKSEKDNLTEIFSSLQAEHLDLTGKHQNMEKSYQELEKSDKEKTSNLEALRLQLEDLQQQLEDLNAKNFNMTTEIYNKEEEFREELSAREGTIQELTVTLTNNQKQSMENYNALQEDKSSLETKYKNLQTENEKQQRTMEEKLKLSEEERSREIKELQEKIESLVEEINKQKKSPVIDSEASGVAQSDSSVTSSSTSHSLVADKECVKVVGKEKEIEILTKKGNDLQEALELTQKKLNDKESEMKTLVDSDIPKLQQTIKELTAELEAVKGKSSTRESFESHEKFEAIITAKEEKIQELESKVSELDKCMDYITQLEGKLEGVSQVPNNVESHLEQINKLSTDISKLKEELMQSCGECEALKNTITQLENEKKNVEIEKANLVKEYESKLQKADTNLQEANAELEKKKNSVERLELELSRSSSSHVEEVAKLESSHIGRVAELVKLHKHKVDELKVSNAAIVSELNKHIDKIYEEKVALNEELDKIKLELNKNLSKREVIILEEKNDLQSKIQVLQQNIVSLEKEKQQIEEEKRILKNGYEEEQIMAMEMQTQMVSDLEKLILNLESDKGSLEKQVAQLQASCDVHSGNILESEKKVAICEDLVINIAKEKEILKDEIKKLKEIIGEETVSRIKEDHLKSKTIEELTAKNEKLENYLEKAQISLEEQEEIYAMKLNEERDDHLMQLKALRKELSEEVSVIEERKEQLELEYEEKIALVIAEYQEQISTVNNTYETRMLEEKAQFGRVLVTKIDEYEGKLAAHADEISSYETQLDALQSEIDEKVKVIEELECSLDEMTLMRAALRAQVDDLKLTMSKMNESGEESYLDILQSEYETRLNDIQEHYESQLSYLRSLLSGTEYEVQAAGCSSPSQGSEYSIELSCLRPYLQGQSSPIADLASELRSQSAQESQSGFGGNSEIHALSQSFHLLTRSSSGTKSKEDIQSYSSADGKIGITLTSLSAHLRTKSISKAKSKCKSNGSIPRVLLNSASRSELKLLQASLGKKSEPLANNSKSKIQQTIHKGPQQTGETNNGIIYQAQPIDHDYQCPEVSKDGAKCEPQLPSPDLDSPTSSTMGAKPRPPRRIASKCKSSPSTKPSTSVDTDPLLATNIAISSTTQPSDPDPNNTALDKYRIKVEMSTCCIVLSERLRVIETTMEETSAQLATSTAGCAGLEERLQQAKATCETLTAQVEALSNNNHQLTEKIESYEKEKEETTKTIAMLEFNNEHNRNKVLNMELSNKDLQGKIEALWNEKGELMRQLREGSSGIYEQLTKEKEELEQKSAKEKEELQKKHITDERGLQDQLEGLMEIRLGYEKQISQIEVSNAEMHGKIGGIQLERDAAKSEAAQLMTQKLDMDKKLEGLTKVKENLDEQVLVLKGTISNLEEKSETEENRSQTLSETINTLQNNILNLQKQVEGLNETSGKLARDLQSESKLRIETQAQLSQVKQMHKQLEESYTADRITIDKLESEKKDLEMTITTLKETEVKVSELQARIAELESDRKTLSAKLSIVPDTVDTPNDNKVNIVVEQLTEKTQTNINERRNPDEEEIIRLKALLKEKDEEVNRIQQSLKDVQERLRLAEVISGEVEEQREKMRNLEAKMVLAEEQHRQQVKTVSLEAEKWVTAKEQECQQTISSAYDQQDSETSTLVRQHRDILREAQEEAREKAAALDSVAQDYQNQLKEKDEELCKFVQQYEEQLASLNMNHELHIKEVEATWKSRAERMVRQRERQLQEEKDALSQEWNKERRELERLTQVAAAAFRSGTESVELLKKQVAAQRRELEEVKMNHGKEIGELKALLELKRRTRGGVGGGVTGTRLGMALEEAAEFEYLKNILYQYMLGKETQTLSKVLCAVVKFDSQQQQEILDHEEHRQSLQLQTEPSTVHSTLLGEESCDLSKTL
ncbi:golgin subfamily A member 4-like [Homarus americanus]|uniref:golgin subfamily A member 4-like n=1 Tax=Homarus americanus TaxID=6706 RepID=UPI001C481E83|nr:golgin subfamily A member 4-like [Homarus americanus]